MAHTTSDGPTGHRAGAALPAGSALVAVLLGVAGGAWLVSARLATPDMRLGVLTGTSTMSTRTMSASSQMGRYDGGDDGPFIRPRRQDV